MMIWDQPRNLMNALQAYLRELRKGRGLNQADFGDAIGLSRRAIIDWEKGETGALKNAQLFRAIDALGAAVHHVRYLSINEHTPIEYAIELAQAWIRGEDKLAAEAIIGAFENETQLRQVVDLIRPLGDDPKALDQLAGYIHRMLDEQGTSKP